MLLNKRDMEDERLMMMVKDGDEEAFKMLFERYKGKIFRFGMRMMRDQQYAEDLCQEVFVKIYMARKRYRPKGSFKAYIFRIAYTSALNIIKRKGYREKEHFSLQNLKDFKGYEPFTSEEKDERLESLRKEFLNLPERQRAAIELALFHHMDYENIGKVLGCSKRAAKLLVFRAKEKLKERIRNEM